MQRFKRRKPDSTGPLDDDEFSTLISLAKRVLWADRETKRRIQSHKLNITPMNFYSNLPSVEDVESSFEFEGIDRVQGSYNSPSVFNLEETAAFLAAIEVYADEFDPPEKEISGQSAHFYWNNNSFSFMDAMSYYCILRHMKPKRVLEIGSGNSTIVADMALRKNGFGEMTLIEPYPLEYLGNLESVVSIRKSFIQAVEISELLAMVDSAEILFIDSTHTVKVGSDCLYIYLKLLPQISKSILVHSHDIALPYALPPAKTDKHIYWTEQYLLYAYLLDNPKTKVLTGSYYAQRQLPEISQRLMRGRYNDGGGSIWYSLDATKK